MPCVCANWQGVVFLDFEWLFGIFAKNFVICGEFLCMQYYILQSVLFISILFSLTSCMSSQKVFDRVEYRYQDSSVPPKYHRSYSIDMSSQNIKTDVDVYNKHLAGDSRAVQEADWKKLQELAQKLEAPATKLAKGATGTKTYIIRLHNGLKPVYELIWDSLNEVNADTEAFVSFLKSLVPNLEQLKATEYKAE